MKLTVTKDNEYHLFSAGCEDNAVYAVKMPQAEDRDLVMQLFVLDNSWVMETCNCQWKERAFTLIEKAYNNQDILFVGENCDSLIYIIDTRKSIFERLENLDKEEKKDA